MVVAWLRSSPAFARYHDKASLPFKKSTTIRRKLDLNVLGAISAESHIVAALKLEPRFQYDHFKHLQEHERAQYIHWTQTLAIDSDSLWFFCVRKRYKLTVDVSTSTYCSRQVSKTFRMLDVGASSALMQDLGDAPDWLPEDVQLCVILPRQFCDPIAVVTWDSIPIPSPFCKRTWGTPRWFQLSLHPGLKNAFANTMEHVGLQEEDPFTFNMSSGLASQLRTVISGTATPVSLRPWVVRLQKFADNLHMGFEGKRSRKSMDHIIHLVLLSDLLKNSDDLKTAIMGSCRLALPPDIFQSCVQHCETLRVVNKSEISRFRLTMDVAAMLRARVRNWQLYQQGVRSCRYVLWNSSPQFHRDYELVLIDTLTIDDDLKVVEAMYSMAQSVQLEAEDLAQDEERMVMQFSEMETVRVAISRHALQCVLTR